MKDLRRLLTVSAMRAAMRWPVFSVTSYGMVRSLIAAGIRPRTILDAGANVGQFAVAAASLMPEVAVYSFEPDATAYERLRQNTASMAQIHTFELALSDRDGTGALHRNKDSRVSSLRHLSKEHLQAFPHATEQGEIQIELRTLDSWAREHYVDGPILLKLDVQGSEADVLAGARHLMQRVDACLVECSFVPMYQGEALFADLVDLFNRTGFRLNRPLDFLRSPGTGAILQADILFTRNESKGDRAGE